MSLPKLPRGHLPPTQETPIATARWAFPYELEKYAYKEGDIWLGILPIPREEDLPELQLLEARRDAVAQDQSLDAQTQADALAEIDDRIAELSSGDELAIGLDDDRHMATKGSTRAGKGTSCIVPNLCLYPGSVICIDPKGENASITAARRGMGARDIDGLGQTVAVLDPYDTTKLADDFKAAWNPLDMLDVEDDMVVDRATSVAEALVVRTNPEHAHFDESARSLIKAIILYVALVHEGRPDRTLITVYDYLMRGAVEQLEADRREEGPSPDDPDAFTYLLFLMRRRDEFDGIIAGAAMTILGMGDRERGSVLSTARRNMEFVERPAMQRVLAASSFDLDAIKTDPAGVSLFLCLPPQRMPDCGRWLRLVINMALNRMYELDEPPATGRPVLFLLEEFASLGHMEIIEHAAGYAAGFGVKLWMIIQDVPQLKRHYKDGWETLLGNAGVIQAFANSDETTLAFLSKKLGEAEVVQRVRNTSTNLSASTNDPGEYARMSGLMANPQSTGHSASTSDALNEQIQRTPLLLPDEIERLFKRENMDQLVLIKGEVPMILTRTNYFEHPRFAGMVRMER